MKNRQKQFDKTHLSIDTAYETGLVHKDYIAHCHRWNYVLKYLERRDSTYKGDERYKHSNVLDVGCGKDLQLYKILCTNKMGATPSYTGVDINPLELPTKFANRKLPVHLIQQDFCSIKELPIKPNVVTSFEMLEHVPFDYSQQVLNHMYSLSTDDATLIMSTPVYYEKYGMAKNHMNEMTREEVMTQLDNAGWYIHNNVGTFSTRQDLRSNLTKEHRRLYDEFSEYYCGHVMATIFAPLYPEFSRNNLWVCKKTRKDVQLALSI